MTFRILALLLCAVALPVLAQDIGASGAAPAQDDGDWDVLRDPRKKLVMASTLFDNGLGIAVRCVDQSYEALLVGLPVAPEGETRPLRLAYGDKPMFDSTWNVAIEPTVAVSSYPAPFARSVREGGRMQIVVPNGAGDGRNLRYDLTLPASGAAIDETLAACGRPLDDPRDAELADIGASGLPGDMIWRRAPRPTYPTRSRYAKGFAVVSCLSNPDGSLRDCVIETEHPQGGHFGEATLRSIGTARLRMTADQDAPVAARQVGFRVTYRLEGYTEALRSPSRIRTPESREADR